MSDPFDPPVVDFPYPRPGDRVVTWDGYEAVVVEELDELKLFIVRDDDGTKHGLYARDGLLPDGAWRVECPCEATEGA